MEGEGGLEPLAGVVDFKGGYPFDPLVASSVGCDEAEGEAVAVGDDFVADGGGEEKLFGFVYGEAAVVAGY